MRYLALLGGDESLQPGPGTPEFDAVLERYWQFHEKNDEAILAGEALQPSITATTVRHRDGQPLVTSGPFAETVEALGGFYVLEAETLDDAIELARQIPAASDGWVAVRPMVEWFDRSAAVDASDGDPPVPGPPPEGARFLALILRPGDRRRRARHARVGRRGGRAWPVHRGGRVTGAGRWCAPSGGDHHHGPGA